MAIKKTKNGYLMKSDNGDWILNVNVARYADRINKACIPTIKDLNLMTRDLATMVRYCCKGGRERMKKAFSSGIPAGSSFSSLAETMFNNIMAQHPEFEECANAWKFVNLIKIDENGLFAADDEAISERRKVYVRAPECMAFVDKTQKIADLLNELFPQHERMDARFTFNSLKEFIFFDGKENKFAVNPNISEYSIKKLLFIPQGFSRFGKSSEFDEFYARNAAARNLEFYKAKAMEFGLDEKETLDSIAAEG